MHNILIACSLASVAVAAPKAEADADAIYGQYGYGHAYPALYNSYPNWLALYAPRLSRTFFTPAPTPTTTTTTQAPATGPVCLFWFFQHCLWYQK